MALMVEETPLVDGQTGLDSGVIAEGFLEAGEQAALVDLDRDGLAARRRPVGMASGLPLWTSAFFCYSFSVCAVQLIFAATASTQPIVTAARVCS